MDTAAEGEKSEKHATEIGFCAKKFLSAPSAAYPTTLSFAKRNNSCFCPALGKKIVAFWSGGAPSTFTTLPLPKRSCSTVTPSWISAATASPNVLVASNGEPEVEIFFKLRFMGGGGALVTAGRLRS